MRRLSTGLIVTRRNSRGEIELLFQFKRSHNEWEFPGGKLDGTETSEECASRELKEEVSLEAVNLEQLFYLDYGLDYGCVMFLITEWEGQPSITEPDKQSAIGWFPLSNLPRDITQWARLAIEKGCLLGLGKLA